MKRTSSLIALFALTVLIAQPTYAQSDSSSQPAPAAAKPTFLTGGVHHSERLSEVPAALQAGAKFDESQLPDIKSDNVWIPIPKWMAGTWQFKTEDVTAMQNWTKENYTPPPYTLKNEHVKVLGQQTDKTGQIWHYMKTPYHYTTKLDHKNLGYERVVSSECFTNTDLTVGMNLVGSSTDVQEKSKKVVSTDQAEEIINYTPLPDNKLCVQSSAKHFDMTGTPTMQLDSNSVATMSKPYAEVDDDGGANLKSLFYEFLRSHGKADLIPDGAA